MYVYSVTDKVIRLAICCYLKAPQAETEGVTDGIGLGGVSGSQIKEWA